MTRIGFSGLLTSRYEMNPLRPADRRYWPCHKQETCWSSTALPMLNSVTTVFVSTSHNLQVLSPEAVSNWVPSGFQATWVHRFEECHKPWGNIWESSWDWSDILRLQSWVSGWGYWSSHRNSTYPVDSALVCRAANFRNEVGSFTVVQENFAVETGRREKFTIGRVADSLDEPRMILQSISIRYYGYAALKKLRT